MNKPGFPYRTLWTIKGVLFLHVLSGSPPVQPSPSPGKISSASQLFLNFDTEIKRLQVVIDYLVPQKGAILRNCSSCFAQWALIKSIKDKLDWMMMFMFVVSLFPRRKLIRSNHGCRGRNETRQVFGFLLQLHFLGMFSRLLANLRGTCKDVRPRGGFVLIGSLHQASPTSWSVRRLPGCPLLTICLWCV